MKKSELNSLIKEKINKIQNENLKLIDEQNKNVNI